MIGFSAGRLEFHWLTETLAVLAANHLYRRVITGCFNLARELLVRRTYVKVPRAGCSLAM